MRRTAAVFCALCALVAAGTAVADKQESPRAPLLSQGGAIPLVAAERALKSGYAAAALGHFKVVEMRARREGLITVAERVRRRLASAGRDQYQGSLESGWPLLAHACLYAPDFSAAATAVEEWAIESPARQARFSYPLFDAASGQSPWGTEPDRLPAWALRKLPPGRSLKSVSSRLANVTVAELPPKGRFALVLPMRLRIYPPFPFELASTRVDGGGDAEVYASIHGKVQWDRRLAPLGAAKQKEGTFAPARDWVLDRLLFFQDGPAVRESVHLVREYASLPDADATP